MNKLSIGIGIVAVAILSGAIYFGVSMKQSQENVSLLPKTVNTTRSTTSEKTTTPGTEQTTQNNEKMFTVIGENFSFTPNTIEVKKGDTVKITFQNKKGFHDWVIDEFQSRTKQIKTDEEETIQFVANKVGSFEYYCSVGNHRQMGMKGTLLVSE
jgi:nitrite reductase (NO-forming)